MIGFATEIGIAYPTPSTSEAAILAELIPITCPCILIKAPPLLPGLIAASVWIALIVLEEEELELPLSDSEISRSFALI